MELTDMRVILMVLAVVGIVYFLYNRNSAVPNEGSLEDVVDMDDTSDPENNEEEEYDQEYEQDSMDAELDKKINNSRNRAVNGSGYKSSDYARGNRNQTGSWENSFDAGNSVIPMDDNGDNQFAPNESTLNNFASFSSSGNATCGSNQDCEPEDLFDADKMLPQEVNDDWYQVLPEPVSVKNRHLINVTKPIGVNTIGQSKGNASYDIRGTVPNPKTVVSPWLNSSIEPDHNLRPCLC